MPCPSLSVRQNGYCQRCIARQTFRLQVGAHRAHRYAYCPIARTTTAAATETSSKGSCPLPGISGRTPLNPNNTRPPKTRILTILSRISSFMSVSFWIAQVPASSIIYIFFNYSSIFSFLLPGDHLAEAFGFYDVCSCIDSLFSDHTVK